MTDQPEITPTAEQGTEASIRLEFEEWALNRGYSIFRKPGNPYYYEADTEALWQECLSRNAGVTHASSSAPLEQPAWPECSGDPASCPENEGYGCGAGKIKGRADLKAGWDALREKLAIGTDATGKPVILESSIRAGALACINAALPLQAAHVIYGGKNDLNASSEQEKNEVLAGLKRLETRCSTMRPAAQAEVAEELAAALEMQMAVRSNSGPTQAEADDVSRAVLAKVAAVKVGSDENGKEHSE